MRRCPLVTLGAAVAISVATACSNAPVDRVAGAGDFGHIHDLVETADGMLLAASHTGLYRIDDAETAVLVGTEQHDLMSMTATADTLFASGHPDLRLPHYRVEGMPAHLGLAESTDGGRTWDVDPELLGARDFHALLPTDRGVYAADTEGHVSLRRPDGTWVELGELSARDLAADPDDADVLAATDDNGGMWHSFDGGQSWDSASDAPPLIEIEWTRDGRLIAADADGTIWTSTEPSARWTALANAPNGMETLLIDHDQWWVAGHGGTIHTTTDGGATWEVVYSPPPR